MTDSLADSDLRRRALGAFYGLALGDALGMPTQSFSRADIISRFGSIDTLHDGPADQPIAPGMPAGSITDDTEQAVLVAELLINGKGHIEPVAFARALTDWEADMKARGSQDLLGPSTNRALAMIAEGISPEQSGRFGTTNGAAMRITPVAIATPATPRETLLEAVIEASRVTHNTSLGIASAAAVAGAISAGLEGAPLDQALRVGHEMAVLGEQQGHWSAGGLISARIEWARQLVRGRDQATGIALIHDLIGTSVAAQESVVATFALAELAGEEPRSALTLAAGIGGDTDTIAAMLGAILGACHGPEGLPAALVEQVARVSHFAPEPLVDQLLMLRQHHAPTHSG
ncbi:ADP-ribosylglycohydrolase family protein [Kushneria phosphatilytica]|uniref:ADP-ribosylglycohydrolase family protein n=1 Tax=Kushneria phosphatilytica TaxID=657387 RepID=A0A1S1NWN5_9GAMM|nr:ADP-ribosylglycohydrolase family protein [Kushneria phosphatilytica]OHV08698.1 ADP-ribosylglycohydrolase [Kushneria phosphatilytica]QEL12418.1 ADP-ribosylglycohydrolase family protein [Kushneria phosphatilytica]